MSDADLATALHQLREQLNTAADRTTAVLDMHTYRAVVSQMQPTAQPTGRVE